MENIPEFDDDKYGRMTFNKELFKMLQVQSDSVNINRQ